MNLAINPACSKTYNCYFAGKNKNKAEKKTTPVEQPTQQQITTAKTKKALSECKYVLLGVMMLYFAMKRTIKHDKIKKALQIQTKLAKSEAPVADVLTEDILKNMLKV